MKFTATLAAIAGVTMAGSHHVPFTHMELAQIARVDPSATTMKQQFAQVSGATTVGDVGHPDDRETESPILDRNASDKLNGLVSYQRFLDHRVNALKTAYAADEEGADFVAYPENGLYNTSTHVCAYRFRWTQPFSLYTDRYLIAVTHDCPDGLVPAIGGFKFVITLAGYDLVADGTALVNDIYRSHYNPHPEVAVNDGLISVEAGDSTISFELARDSHDAYNAFGILLPISYNAVEEAEPVDAEGDGKWTYTYEILNTLPYSG